MPQTKRLYRIKELSEMSSISEKTLYDWASQRRFSSYAPGGIVLIDINDFMAFLSEHKREAAPLDARARKMLQGATK